jgi:hypothetical protein
LSEITTHFLKLPQPKLIFSDICQHFYFFWQDAKYFGVLPKLNMRFSRQTGDLNRRPANYSGSDSTLTICAVKPEFRLSKLRSEWFRRYFDAENYSLTGSGVILTLFAVKMTTELSKCREIQSQNDRRSVKKNGNPGELSNAV